MTFDNVSLASNWTSERAPAQREMTKAAFESDVYVLDCFPASSSSFASTAFPGSRRAALMCSHRGFELGVGCPPWPALLPSPSCAASVRVSCRSWCYCVFCEAYLQAKSSRYAGAEVRAGA